MGVARPRRRPSGTFDGVPARVPGRPSSDGRRRRRTRYERHGGVHIQWSVRRTNRRTTSTPRGSRPRGGTRIPNTPSALDGGTATCGPRPCRCRPRPPSVARGRRVRRRCRPAHAGAVASPHDRRPPHRRARVRCAGPRPGVHLRHRPVERRTDRRVRRPGGSNPRPRRGDGAVLPALQPRGERVDARRPRRARGCDGHHGRRGASRLARRHAECADPAEVPGLDAGRRARRGDPRHRVRRARRGRWTRRHPARPGAAPAVLLGRTQTGLHDRRHRRPEGIPVPPVVAGERRTVLGGVRPARAAVRRRVRGRGRREFAVIGRDGLRQQSRTRRRPAVRRGARLVRAQRRRVGRERRVRRRRLRRRFRPPVPHAETPGPIRAERRDVRRGWGGRRGRGAPPACRATARNGP